MITSDIYFYSSSTGSIDNAETELDLRIKLYLLHLYLDSFLKKFKIRIQLIQTFIILFFAIILKNIIFRIQEKIQKSTLSLTNRVIAIEIGFIADAVLHRLIGL